MSKKFINISFLTTNQRYNNADLKISLYVCVHIKKYPENFAFLILRILEIFAREV